MKEEFVTLARQREGSFGALCQRYGISRACGYKWLRRYEKAGVEGLEEHSRRPIIIPTLPVPRSKSAS